MTGEAQTKQVETKKNEIQTYRNSLYSSNELQKMIVTQIEYYFSEENLANDYWLLSQLTNKKLEIAKLMTFPKVLVLTNDEEFVVESIKKLSKRLEITNSKGTFSVGKKNLKQQLIFNKFSAKLTQDVIQKTLESLGIKGIEIRKNLLAKKWFLKFQDAEKAKKALEYFKKQMETPEWKEMLTTKTIKKTKDGKEVEETEIISKLELKEEEIITNFFKNVQNFNLPTNNNNGTFYPAKYMFATKGNFKVNYQNNGRYGQNKYYNNNRRNQYNRKQQKGYNNKRSDNYKFTKKKPQKVSPKQEKKEKQEKIETKVEDKPEKKIESTEKKEKTENLEKKEKKPIKSVKAQKTKKKAVNPDMKSTFDFPTLPVFKKKGKEPAKNKPQKKNVTTTKEFFYSNDQIISIFLGLGKEEREKGTDLLTKKSKSELELQKIKGKKILVFPNDIVQPTPRDRRLSLSKQRIRSASLDFSPFPISPRSPRRQKIDKSVDNDKILPLPKVQKSRKPRKQKTQEKKEAPKKFSYLSALKSGDGTVAFGSRKPKKVQSTKKPVESSQSKNQKDRKKRSRRRK